MWNYLTMSDKVQIRMALETRKDFLADQIKHNELYPHILEAMERAAEWRLKLNQLLELEEKLGKVT